MFQLIVYDIVGVQLMIGFIGLIFVMCINYGVECNFVVVGYDEVFFNEFNVGFFGGFGVYDFGVIGVINDVEGINFVFFNDFFVGIYE